MRRAAALSEERTGLKIETEEPRCNHLPDVALLPLFSWMKMMHAADMEEENEEGEKEERRAEL